MKPISNKCPNLLKFYLEIPFIEIETQLMCYAWERETYHYLAWHIQIWKWRWTVVFGKRARDMHNK